MMKKIFTIFTFVVSFGIVSCGPEVKEQPGRIGVEATEADFQKTVNQALEGISTLKAQKGAFVYYEQNQRTEAGGVIATEVTQTAVNDIKENSTSITYVLDQDWFKFSDTGAIIDQKHSQLVLPPFLKSPPTILQKNIIQASNENPCDGVDQDDQFGRPYDCIKLFNLVYQIREVDPPELVKAKPNCMDLPNCKMTVRFLSFDNVEWKNGIAVATYTNTYEISPDVPDIMYKTNPIDGVIDHGIPALSHCTKFVYPNEQNSLVTLCDVLRDFNP